jgi:uncharacterized protein (TIGR03086 family)
MTDQGHGQPQGPGRGGDPVAMMARADDAARAVIDRVTPEQMGLPTPCAEWNVRQVINHLIVSNVWTGQCLEQGSAPRPAPTDMTGDDPAAAFADSERAVLAAFREPDNLQRMVEMPFGTMPGAALAGVRMMELLVHAWDIAKATGQTIAPSDALLDVCEGTAAAVLPIVPEGFFAPSVPGGETRVDRLAALTGRTV